MEDLATIRRQIDDCTARRTTPELLAIMQSIDEGADMDFKAVAAVLGSRHRRALKSAQRPPQVDVHDYVILYSLSGCKASDRPRTIWDELPAGATPAYLLGTYSNRSSASNACCAFNSSVVGSRTERHDLWAQTSTENPGDLPAIDVDALDRLTKPLRRKFHKGELPMDVDECRALARLHPPEVQEAVAEFVLSGQVETIGEAIELWYESRRRLAEQRQQEQDSVLI